MGKDRGIELPEWELSLKIATYQTYAILEEGYDLSKYYGFIYRINNLTNGKFYIGKKSFWSNRRVKLGKKALAARKDGRSSKYKRVKKMSKWRGYTGSNKQLNEDIQNGHEIERQIIRLCESKKGLTYYEVKEQMVRGVLETDDSYNDNVLAKFYRKDLL